MTSLLRWSLLIVIFFPATRLSAQSTFKMLHGYKLDWYDGTRLAVEPGTAWTRNDNGESLIVKTSENLRGVPWAAPECLVNDEHPAPPFTIIETVGCDGEPKNGVNGIAIGESIVGETWYYIWVIAKFAEPHLAGFLLSQYSDPALVNRPPDYDYYRMLPIAVRTNLGGQFQKFRHFNFPHTYFDYTKFDSNAIHVVLANGTEISRNGEWHEIDLSKFIPPGKHFAQLVIDARYGYRATRSVFIRPKGGMSSGILAATVSPENTIVSGNHIKVPVSADQKIEYRWSGNTIDHNNRLIIYVKGYYWAEDN